MVIASFIGRIILRRIGRRMSTTNGWLKRGSVSTHLTARIASMFKLECRLNIIKPHGAWKKLWILSRRMRMATTRGCSRSTSLSCIMRLTLPLKFLSPIRKISTKFPFQTIRLGKSRENKPIFQKINRSSGRICQPRPVPRP